MFYKWNIHFVVTNGWYFQENALKSLGRVKGVIWMGQVVRTGKAGDDYEKGGDTTPLQTI